MTDTSCSYSERELRDMFSKYGQVQTCIVNKEKRHAFVKMVCRDDAVRAKEAMEHREGDPQLRVCSLAFNRQSLVTNII